MTIGIKSTDSEPPAENLCQLTKKRGRPYIESVNEVGRRIRERREQLGLDQIAAGERCSVDSSTLSRIETGERPNPRIETLAKIARGLGLSLDDLMDLPLPAAVSA